MEYIADLNFLAGASNVGKQMNYVIIILALNDQSPNIVQDKVSKVLSHLIFFFKHKFHDNCCP